MQHDQVSSYIQTSNGDNFLEGKFRVCRYYNIDSRHRRHEPLRASKITRADEPCSVRGQVVLERDLNADQGGSGPDINKISPPSTRSRATLCLPSRPCKTRPQYCTAAPQYHPDTLWADFILTHKIFMPTGNLCQELLKHYQCQPKQSKRQQQQTAVGKLDENSNLNQQQSQQTSQLDDEYLVAKKRRVVKFVRCWMLISREQFFHHQQIQSFLTVSWRAATTSLPGEWINVLVVARIESIYKMAARQAS